MEELLVIIFELAITRLDVEEELRAITSHRWITTTTIPDAMLEVRHVAESRASIALIRRVEEYAAFGVRPSAYTSSAETHARRSSKQPEKSSS